MKEITVEELLTLKNPIIIDIRAPIEFKEGSIPGAINIPLFTDEERHEIGTIYKQEGQSNAKWRAMERVSPKIPAILKQIKEIMSDGDELVIHCWRGGMRSKAVVTFLEFAGIYASRLVGGYKAYRQYILKKLPTMFPEKAVVLHGLTGVGKTEVLQRIKIHGYPTLDLEAMAGHRGSIFGTVGLEDGHNQKTFDSLLYKALNEIQESSHFIMEAESKRIGKAVQPVELMERKMKGIHLHLHLPFEKRVEHLVNEYVTPYKELPWYHEKISVSIEKILKRVKDTEVKERLATNLVEKNYPDLIRILLDHYYDPRYDYKRLEYDDEFIEVFANNLDDLTEKVMVELKKLSIDQRGTLEGELFT